MKDVIYLLFHLLSTLDRLARPGGGRTVIAENLLLKQQLIIHSRSRQRAPNLTTQDRTLLGFLSLFMHPKRIARSSWLTTIGHAKDSLWSVDLFRCESIGPASRLLKSQWVMVVMDQYTRRIIGFGVHTGNVDGPALCSMFNDATSGQGWPQWISSDNDPLFHYHRWKANLRVLEIEEIKSLLHVPTSHPFVERLIGSVRRELLDQTLFWTASDLENKRQNYQRHYNGYRCHSGRDGATPVNSGSEKVVALNDYRWEKHCRGLFKLTVAA
jgi:putative transposase